MVGGNDKKGGLISCRGLTTDSYCNCVYVLGRPAVVVDENTEYEVPWSNQHYVVRTLHLGVGELLVIRLLLGEGYEEGEKKATKNYYDDNNAVRELS